jgi:hypothetical protein
VEPPEALVEPAVPFPPEPVLPPLPDVSREEPPLPPAPGPDELLDEQAAMTASTTTIIDPNDFDSICIPLIRA